MSDQVRLRQLDQVPVEVTKATNEEIGASDQERLRWLDQVPVEVTWGNYKMMALQTIEVASWPDQVPVKGIDAQVPICGRYSRSTKISQLPGEVASVRGIALMLWRA